MHEPSETANNNKHKRLSKTPLLFKVKHNNTKKKGDKMYHQIHSRELEKEDPTTPVNHLIHT